MFNGVAILHTTMSSGDKLHKLPSSQVPVSTGNCLAIAVLSSSKIVPLTFFDMPQVSPFLGRTGAVEFVPGFGSGA